MAKVTILGKAAVLTSSVKRDDLEKIQKYEPSMLALKNEKGQEYFAVGVNGEGHIGQYGVTFNDKDAKGYARITICGVASKQDFVDTFGKVLLNLNKLEEALGGRLEELNETMSTIENSIEVK